MMKTGGRKRGWRMGFYRGGGRCRNVGATKSSVKSSAGILSNTLDLLRKKIATGRMNRGSHTGSIHSAGPPKTFISHSADRMIVPSNAGQGNRQTRDTRFQVFVDVRKCVGCGICAQVCPRNAIVVNEVAKIDRRRCDGCGRCVAKCPQNALILRNTFLPTGSYNNK